MTPDQSSDHAIIDLLQTASQQKQAGQLSAALATYQQAIALDDRPTELWFNYGNLLRQLNQLTEAKAAYEQAIARQADLFPAHLNLGNVCRDLGDITTAIAQYQRAIQLNPPHPLAYRNLAQVCLNQNQLEPIAALFPAWAKADGQNPLVWNLWGMMLQQRSQPEQALNCFQRAVQIAPNHFDSLNNLGFALIRAQRPHDALPYLQRALGLNDRSVTTRTNLIEAHLGVGEVGAAIAQSQQLLAQQPDSAAAYTLGGFALVQQGRLREAIQSFDRAAQLVPNYAKAVTNALFAMLYRDDRAAVDLLDDTRQWVARLPQPAQRYTQWDGDRDPDRVLKIGYLSGDLRAHPVAFFLEPILNHHDPAQVNVTVYNTTEIADNTTRRFQAMTPNWVDCADWPDDRLAAQIHADHIDILVDLAGHTGTNRIGVFQRKPAPVQILYIGYPGSMGLPEMDYIIVDERIAPPDADALYTQLYSEQLLRVNSSVWCFRPQAGLPAPNDLPALTKGHLSLGSFNAAPKLSPTTICLWSQVLQALPNATLRLKALSFGDGETCTYFRQQFAAQGIDSDRLIFEPPTLQFEQFFTAYHQIDIALDPTPYGGGTTTCEALWMGVPVVTLQGDRFSARMSHSFVTQVGLEPCSTGSAAEYVQAVVNLAADLDALQQLRQTLRDRVVNSSICAAPATTQALETAYRQAWQAQLGEWSAD